MGILVEVGIKDNSIEKKDTVNGEKNIRHVMVTLKKF
jgi:hypothetical protein